MMTKPVFYVYSLTKTVSFRVIAEKHVKLLKQYFRVEPIDENAFPTAVPVASLVYESPILVQPYFYNLQRYEKHLTTSVENIRGIIGVDVADSDHITEYGVKLAEYATALIVPSNFSRNSYLNSGVKKPVHVVPHGIDDSYLDTPKQKPNTFKPLAELKQKNNLTLIQCWILHSPYRKGLDLLAKFHEELLKETENILLIIRTAKGIMWFTKPIKNPEEPLERQMDGCISIGWLTETQKLELNDLCDIYFLSSRGGAFEHPALEAMARGEITLGAQGGAWQDFLPEWALIQSQKSDQILLGNPIHDGCGVELLIDKAVDKTFQIINNLDEYRAKTAEHVNTVVKEQFTWSKIGKRLRDVVKNYL
jgi:glycosyltransferase involved in cell wall biosynthesis